MKLIEGRFVDAKQSKDSSKEENAKIAAYKRDRASGGRRRGVVKMRSGEFGDVGPMDASALSTADYIPKGGRADGKSRRGSLEVAIGSRRDSIDSNSSNSSGGSSRSSHRCGR